MGADRCSVRAVKGYIRKSHVLFAMKEYGKALQAIELVRAFLVPPPVRTDPVAAPPLSLPPPSRSPQPLALFPPLSHPRSISHPRSTSHPLSTSTTFPHPPGRDQGHGRQAHV